MDRSGTRKEIRENRKSGNDREAGGGERSRGEAAPTPRCTPRIPHSYQALSTPGPDPASRPAVCQAGGELLSINQTQWAVGMPITLQLFKTVEQNRRLWGLTSSALLSSRAGLHPLYGACTSVRVTDESKRMI